MGALATWRLAHLLHAEDGPFDVVVKLRRAAGSSVLGRAMDCFGCTSLWSAALLACLLQTGWRERVLGGLACSGAAILLEGVRQRLSTPPAVYHEAEPDSLGMRDEARRIWRQAKVHDAANDVLRETLARLRVDL